MIECILSRAQTLQLLAREFARESPFARSIYVNNQSYWSFGGDEVMFTVDELADYHLENLSHNLSFWDTVPETYTVAEHELDEHPHLRLVVERASVSSGAAPNDMFRVRMNRDVYAHWQDLLQSQQAANQSEPPCTVTVGVISMTSPDVFAAVHNQLMSAAATTSETWH